MKKIKLLLISIFFILCIPNVVFADTNDITCSDIRNKLNEYNAIVSEYNSLGCDTVTDTDGFERCKNLVNQKYAIVETLYSYNDRRSDCNIDGLSAVLSENSDQCSNSFSSEIKDFSDKVMNFFYMIAPFLLILFGSLDLLKIVAAGDPLFTPKSNEGKDLPSIMQKNRKNFIRRIIAFILVYFTPFFVNQLLSMTVYDLSGNKYTCNVVVTNPATSLEVDSVLYSGIYGVDNSVSYDAEASNKILTAAHSIASSWASQKFMYFTDGPGYSLISHNIVASISNPSKGTCCATLIGATLYKSGLYTENEINAVGYNGASDLAEFLDSKNWQIIEKYDDLEPGDIVFMTSSGVAHVSLRNGKSYSLGHVQIFAGGTNWYNAGSTTSIQASQPSTQGEGYSKGAFVFAMRAPLTSRTRSSSNSGSSGSSGSSSSGKGTINNPTGSSKGTTSNPTGSTSTSTSGSKGTTGTSGSSSSSRSSSSSSSSSKKSKNKGTNK